MSKLRDKLNQLDKDKIKTNWDSIESQEGISTKEKLAKLVNISLKREKFQLQNKSKPDSSEEQNRQNSSIDYGAAREERDRPYLVREFLYPLHGTYGPFRLEEWKNLPSGLLAVIFGDEELENLPLSKLVFFDTETTGLAGGTGTIPFMLGFGFFEEEHFRVCVFILNDLYKEDEFLEAVDAFLEEHRFAGTVTYNGKCFDFPLMEARYILQRRRFPLLRLPHLDFLYSSRTIWKNTYDSRKLGYLGEILLGISRDDDIDASQIPQIYFNYLRSKSFTLIGKVVEHNALDLLGLANLLLLAAKYVDNTVYASDDGEILGAAVLYDKYGDLDRASQIYENLKTHASREDIRAKAIMHLAILKKKLKLFKEASDLWESVADRCEHRVVKELSVYFEHREKNFKQALVYVQKALSSVDLTEAQRIDFEKRWERLNKKIDCLG